MKEHNSKKRYLGEFYTPFAFAKKSLEFINKEINIEELKSGKYRIWDMACGKGNLEFYLDESVYKYLYMSTIDNEDIEYCKTKFKKACIFQYDYLNEDIELKNKIFNYKKIPNKLKSDLENKELNWLIFINPPYATSQVAGTNSKSKKNVSYSLIRNIMHENKLGEASRELSAQFMFRINKEFVNGKNIYLAIFSKTNYIKSNNNEKFREDICNYKFVNGFVFSSSNFESTSKTAPFPVSFIIWKISNEYNIKKENIALPVFDNNCNEIGKKKFQVIDRNKLLNKWIKRVRNSYTFVPLSSAIKIKTSGKDIRDKICDGFIGSLMSCGSDLQKQNLTAIFSAPQSSAGSFSITKDNFEKAMIIHAVRRITKVDWLNGSDQFVIPKGDFEELSEEFKLDCIIWSLFSNSNQTVSMNNVFYKNKYYKIENQFYPFDYKEVFLNNNFFDYERNNDKRFVSEYLKSKEKIMTKESSDLINLGKELYSFFYGNIEKLNFKKFEISLWDAGFWQIRKSLKDAKIGLNIFDKLKLKRDFVRNNIFGEIDRFIS